MRHYPSHLRHVATIPWEIKNSNVLQIWKKMETNCILIPSNFVIHSQILIFLVFRIVSHTHRGIKTGALKMQLVYIFFHISWIYAENLEFIISRGIVAPCLRWDGQCRSVLLQISYAFHQWKKFENWLRFDKVIESLKWELFSRHSVVW